MINLWYTDLELMIKLFIDTQNNVIRAQAKESVTIKKQSGDRKIFAIK